MKIKAEHVRCIELFIGNNSIGLFTKGENWKKLVEIKRVTDGETLTIGNPDFNGFNQIFGDIFGESNDKSETYAINGSNKIIKEIEAIIELNKGNNIET